MKRGISYLLLILFLPITSTIFAQKIKTKSSVCTIQKVKLPTNFSNADERTYDLQTKGLYSHGVDAHNKRIYGWKLDRANPKVRGVVSIYGFEYNSPEKHSEKKEKKDKDGKVVDRWTEYWYTNSARGKATLYVYGTSAPFEYKKKKEVKSKWEEKQEAKAAEAKKDLADNPFLTAEVIDDAAESDVGEDSGLENAVLPFVNSADAGTSVSVTTKKFRSLSSAYGDYTKNHKSKLTSHRNTFPAKAYKNAMYTMNSMYGFSPVNSRFYLKLIKNEDHPDSKMWNDACQATQTIFKTAKYNQSLDGVQKSMEPIVGYFEKQVNKISDDDKKKKKQKKAAFNNLLNILYNLDRHDDAIAWSNKYLDSKKLDKISKRMLEKASKQEAHLAFHKMATCHLESDEKVDAEDIESEELATDEDDD